MGLDFTVAVVPKSTDLNRELQYIKSALLYADRVTLISPLAYMYSQLSSKGMMMNDKVVIRIMKTLLPLVEAKDSERAHDYQSAIAQLSSIVFSKQYKSLPMKSKLDFRRKIYNIASELDTIVCSFIGESQALELNDLLESQKLYLQPFEHNLMDIDGEVEEFCRLLKDSIKNSYPLFDEISNQLMVAAVKSNIVTLSESERRKITHAGLSDNLIQRLPSFEMATVSEILDIRKELNPAISKYRAKVLSYTDSIQSLPWDDSFESECTELYYRDVAPAVSEIGEMVTETSFLKNLGYSALTNGDFLKNIGGLVCSVAAGGVIGAFNDALTTDKAVLLAGGAWAASKVAESFHEYKKTKKEIQHKDLYFYYQAGKLLQE